MKEIGNIIKDFKITENKLINSERAEIISQFVEEINNEREGTKWKPIHPRAVAVKLGHIKQKSDLYFFLKKCREYKANKGSFSKCFWGSLKPKDAVRYNNAVQKRNSA